MNEISILFHDTIPTRVCVQSIVEFRRAQLRKEMDMLEEKRRQDALFVSRLFFFRPGKRLRSTASWMDFMCADLVHDPVCHSRSKSRKRRK